jgi:nitrite reductase/ring-hydroxylating ferredoxin subunit
VPQLPPYPRGWYAVGFSSELTPGAVLSRPFMGGDVVVYRTGSGRACAVDPHCAHLGAHFGYGGRVDGDLLVCPFHGFAYDETGICVRTGYGTKPPPTALIRQRPLRETNGLLLLYHDEVGSPPSWEVPALDVDGWTRTRWREFVLRDHPQETTENSVDFGHFTHVHGYRNPRMLRPAVTDGPYLSTAFAADHALPLLGRRSLAFEFETEIYGLGYSLVNARVPRFGIEARLWVLPTPVDEERLTLRLVASVRRARRPVPHGLLTWVILAGFAYDARQDFPIWENKRYLPRPALADGDGPIGMYRRWARQFYGVPSRDGHAPVERAQADAAPARSSAQLPGA